MVTTIGRRVERYRCCNAAIAFGIQGLLRQGYAIRRGAEVEDADTRVTGAWYCTARITVEVPVGKRELLTDEETGETLELGIYGVAVIEM